MTSRIGIHLLACASALACTGAALAQPVLDVFDASTLEGASGAHAMMFTVRLSEAGAEPVTFHFETLDATATASDSDYVPVAGDFSIAAGDTLALVPVPILGDTLLESNERFVVRISEIVNADPGDTLAVGTILNDEQTTFSRLSVGVTDFGPGTLPPAWGDADGDGRPDLPMYTNIGGLFDETPGMRDALSAGNYHGGAWCDFDRDGDMDLALMPYGDAGSTTTAARLLLNTPEGFVDVAPPLGMNVSGYGETPVWADFDADGWPDLFMPFYAHVAPFRSYLFLNDRDGSFREVADSAGVALTGIPIELRPEGAAAADWNGDGAIDLYCASHLFLNDGTAHFRDVRDSVGLPEAFDEGAQFVDFDDDGDLDLSLRTASGPALFRNDGGTFVDVTASLGIGPLDWAWGDRWVDIDLDGDLDFVYFPPNATPRLLLANGDGTFTDVAAFQQLGLGISLCAFADVDGDGDPDIVVGDYNKRFARNRLEPLLIGRTQYIKVRVEDFEGRLVEQGSTVRLRSLDDPTHPVQTRVVDGGSGYLGQDEYTLTFGGVESGAFDLEVSFPGTPSAPIVVGPAQNPLLGGLRPGDGAPRLVTVRPNGQVQIQDLPRTELSVGTVAIAGPLQAFASPNPARRLTRLDCTLPAPGRLTVRLFDVAGRRVRTLVDERRPAGPASVTWDLRDDAGRALDPGLYVATFSADGRAIGSRKVMVLR